MGMNVKVKGRIMITPPIEFADITNEAKLHIATRNIGKLPTDACFAAERVTVRDGELVDATIVGIEATYPTEGFSNYGLAEDAERLMALYPNRNYSGYLECSTTDDGGDLWRLVPRGLSVVTVKPKVTIEWAED